MKYHIAGSRFDSRGFQVSPSFIIHCEVPDGTLESLVSCPPKQNARARARERERERERERANERESERASDKEEPTLCLTCAARLRRRRPDTIRSLPFPVPLSSPRRAVESVLSSTAAAEQSQTTEENSQGKNLLSIFLASSLSHARSSLGPRGDDRRAPAAHVSSFGRRDKVCVCVRERGTKRNDFWSRSGSLKLTSSSLFPFVLDLHPFNNEHQRRRRRRPARLPHRRGRVGHHLVQQLQKLQDRRCPPQALAEVLVRPRRGSARRTRRLWRVRQDFFLFFFVVFGVLAALLFRLLPLLPPGLLPRQASLLALAHFAQVPGSAQALRLRRRTGGGSGGPGRRRGARRRPRTPRAAPRDLRRGGRGAQGSVEPARAEVGPGSAPEGRGRGGGRERERERRRGDLCGDEEEEKDVEVVVAAGLTSFSPPPIRIWFPFFVLFCYHCQLLLCK